MLFVLSNNMKINYTAKKLLNIVLPYTDKNMKSATFLLGGEQLFQLLLCMCVSVSQGSPQ